MPLPKAFYYVGEHVKKNAQEAIFLSIGIIGALIIFYGLTQTAAQLYFVIGSTMLMSTAMYFQLTYFVALELILMAGHGAILLGIGPVLQIVLPILLCTQLLAYYLLSGRLENIFRLIGISGIAILSIGFAYENQWIFLSGSLAVAIFAFYQAYEGRRVALLWAALNSVFALICAIKLIFYYLT